MILTPGAVNLLTTKEPRWKSHNLRKILNPGPVIHTQGCYTNMCYNSIVTSDRLSSPIRRPACRHAMTAANTVARSSGAVHLVRKPKMEEPAPAPTPERNTKDLKYGALYPILYHNTIKYKYVYINTTLAYCWSVFIATGGKS